MSNQDILNEYNAYHVAEAFRDALGRMYTRGGERWLDTIPKDAILTMRDVRQVKQEGVTMQVFEPQLYRTKLINDHDDMFTLKPECVYGCFYAEKNGKFHNQNLDASEFVTAWDTFSAVSGTGVDEWYKLTDSLVDHARKWE